MREFIRIVTHFDEIVKCVEYAGKSDHASG